MPLTSAPRIISRDDIERLLASSPSTVLSIYLPTERAAVQPEENSLHLKNLLGEAAEKLGAKGYSGKELDAFLSPIEAMLDDRDLWMNQLSGLALFRTVEKFEVFRLPYGAPDIAHAGDAPYLIPLLPSVWPEQEFFVLGPSQGGIKLVHCTRFAAAEVDLSELDMPTSLAEELRYDDLEKPELQHHTTTGPGRSNEGQGNATQRQQKGRRHDFHGHGQDGDDRKEQIGRFFNSVDRGLRVVLKDQDAPMILAGVDYLHPIFRDVSDYPNILDEGIEGAIDRASAEDLHEKAVPLIEAHQRLELEELRERFGNAGAQGLASSDISEILPAAVDGRVDTLFVRGTQPFWGRFDPATRNVIVSDEGGPGDAEDLHDLAARRTLQASGRVFVLEPDEMPVEGNLAALFRYNPAG